MNGSRHRGLLAALSVTATIALLGGCAGAPGPEPSISPSTGPSEMPAPSEPAEPAEPPTTPYTPTGAVTELATGLRTPWSVVLLPSGSALITERDTARILELTAEGKIRTVGTVTGVRHGGEGGLLGVEAVGGGGGFQLYVYFTASNDNRVARIPLRGGPGDYTLGEATVVLSGIARASNHNGGRVKLGPDGKLYITTGDASNPGLSQERASLNGKILRMNLDGTVPDDNPFPGSLVYSMGHRNPQGLAWDASGRMWAAEFGQNTWDELNLIQPGANYGWPVVEGRGERDGYVDPEWQWRTAEASPSGLAMIDGTLFLAALRGSRLWVMWPDSDAPRLQSHFEGAWGRLRDVIPGPDGTIWVLTNNTDGRGSPRNGDDRLLQIVLEER